MKRLILIFILFLSPFTAALAQNADRSERRAAAEERAMAKRLAAIADSLSYVEAMNAIDSMDFVFEADMLIFKRGGTARVFSNLNFISVEGDEALVQVSPFDTGGPNGVGGVTVDGRIVNKEVRVDKRGNVTVSMMVMGAAISAEVLFMIAEGNNRASVRISPTFNSNTITLYGTVVPSERSDIFKGRTL